MITNYNLISTQPTYVKHVTVQHFDHSTHVTHATGHATATAHHHNTAVHVAKEESKEEDETEEVAVGSEHASDAEKNFEPHDEDDEDDK